MAAGGKEIVLPSPARSFQEEPAPGPQVGLPSGVGTAGWRASAEHCVGQEVRREGQPGWPWRGDRGLVSLRWCLS